MYILPKIAGVALLAACFASCDSPQQTSAQKPATDAAAAEEAVMNQHDSLMAKTGQLFELKQKIGAAKAPNAAPYLHGLEAANNAMMGWMHQFHGPDSTATEAQRLAYFQGQQKQLAAVDAQMRSTIDSAQALLKNPSPSAQ